MSARHNAVRHAGNGFESLDLEYVSRLGAFDEDRAGDDVRSVLVEVSFGSVVFGRNGNRILEHVLLGNAFATEVFERIAPLILENSLVREGVDRDGLARLHPHHLAGVDAGHITPHDVRRIRTQIVIATDVSAARLQNRNAIGER